MIKIDSETQIYVYCPENIVTGGTELLHQLVDYLNKLELKAYIVYIDAKYHQPINTNVPEAFLKYNVISTCLIGDTQKNVVILPEILFDISLKFNNVQLMFWWLSVDNYFKSSANYLDLIRWRFNEGLFLILKKIYKKLFTKQKLFTVSISNIKDRANFNCYQSIYANYFLLKNNFPNVISLSDYINTEFIRSDNDIIIDRENKVLYNPAKGLRFTKKIIKKMPHIEWVPLKGLTPSELVKHFKTSKLYIDFGNHPGKDRIPREAAINGCAILTNRRGSANFYEDLPIDKNYKIKDKNLSVIINKIQSIIDNYDSIIDDFKLYKKKIFEEKDVFIKDIELIFKQQK
ncbi:hypothetical protein ETU10_05795 [Apibacter muscae]|uniref:hypothetical protein n=1 Tax=Apibacter muscae TaxID=2509004 RepID=UPI0011AD0FCF|nr:hypothetical protein [Apibacter muscae]TWP23743.1 hypothetical protein ETU10_05795 [Apibacter muscae]